MPLHDRFFSRAEGDPPAALLVHCDGRVPLDSLLPVRRSLATIAALLGLVVLAHTLEEIEVTVYGPEVGTPSISATITNNSKILLDAVEVQATIYDANHQPLGTETRNETELKPGQTWRFTMPNKEGGTAEISRVMVRRAGSSTLETPTINRSAAPGLAPVEAQPVRPSATPFATLDQRWLTPDGAVYRGDAPPPGSQEIKP